ncbi:tributyrin esterase [Enterococcus florum]|uniref:Tributyrin esterase n=1 Tax=Enterococcus florum TaxID=2480627 RepID=A0A4P5PNF0_9ENTE|nr:alpha/beta hydrolase-fold protein [Enterococcus florum]GCF94703.1 tributyrin esterase [Enterococcus florum]
MYIQGSYYSTVLQRSKSYVAILPEKIPREVRVVFLLHGIGSDERTWALNVPLIEYSEKYNVAFFCPAGENSFYTDHADGENYGEAIGKEFYEVIKSLYQLNFERKNVQIAGFSMGGYGAVLLGLRYSELYSRIGAFSPAFVFYKKERKEVHYQKVFSKGDQGSENDCLFQYKKLLNQRKEIPAIQFSCGKEDPLCEQTVKVIDQIKALDSNAPITFYLQAGFHDFSLWSKDLVRFLEI